MRKDDSSGESAFLLALWDELLAAGKDAPAIGSAPGTILAQESLGAKQESAIAALLLDGPARKVLLRAHGMVQRFDAELQPRIQEVLRLFGRDRELRLLLVRALTSTVPVGLVGPTGIGKTRLMLALRWVLENLECPTLYIPKCNRFHEDQLAQMIGAFLTSHADASSPVVLLDEVHHAEGINDLLAKETVTTIYAASAPLGLADETLVWLTELHLPKEGGTSAWAVFWDCFTPRHGGSQQSDKRLTSSLALRLGGVPLTLCLAAACLASEPTEAMVDELGATVGAGTEVKRDDLNEGLAKHLLASLSSEELWVLALLVECTGPVDHEFALALAATTSQPGQVLQRLQDVGLAERVANSWSVSPVVQRELTQLLEDQSRQSDLDPTARHSSVCMERALLIAERFDVGKWSEAVRLLEGAEMELYRAVEVAIEDRDHDVIVKIGTAISRLLFESERFYEFDRLMPELIRSARHLKLSEPVFRAQGLLGARALRNDEVEEARSLWTERLKEAHRVEDHPVELDAHCDLAGLEFEAQNWQQAQDHLDAAELLAQKVNSPELLATALVIRARMMVERGEGSGAEQCLQQVDTLRRSFTNRDQAIFVHQSRCLLLEKLGRTEASKQATLELLKNASDGQRHVLIGWCLRKLADLRESAGDIEGAKTLLVAAAKVHQGEVSRHRKLALNKLSKLLKSEDPEIIGAALSQETAPWESVVATLLTD